MGIYKNSALALTIRRRCRHILIVRWTYVVSALIITTSSVTGLFVMRQRPDIANAYAVPTISNITPDSGSLAGGDTVTISGTGFGSVDGKNFSQIASGSDNSCGISAGKVYCWGNNDYGQLGDGTKTDKLTPTPVRANSGDALYGKTVVQISVNLLYACALTNEGGGKIYCWGYNGEGELGNGNTTDSTVPVAVRANFGDALYNKTITQISVGYNHACALTDENGGKAYCWGYNAFGETGDGTTTQRTTPVAVRANSGDALYNKTITQISAGSAYTCATTNENGGKAYCWGLNDYGNIGNGTTNTEYHTAVAVRANSGDALYNKTITQIVAGGWSACALTDENGGKAYCWGLNDDGQIGDGTTTDRSLPVEVYAGGVLNGKTLTQIDIRTYSTCALTDENGGKAYCWGDNDDGGVGDGTITQRTTPVAVDVSGDLGGKVITHVTTGWGFGCALTNEGKAYCWGYNDRGDLGNGTTDPSLSPTPVDQTNISTSPAPTVLFDGVAATNVTLTSTTELTATTPAGSSPGAVDVSLTNYSNETTTYTNGFTYLGQPPTITSITPNTGSGGDGVTITGTDFDGQSSTFDSISTGSTSKHSCAITDSKIYCWGNNDYGQLGDNSTTSSPTPIAVNTSGVLAGKDIATVATSYGHTCALDTNGKAYCWGKNNHGQLGDGTYNDNDVPVAVNTSGVLNGKTLVDITAGADFTCALDTNGKAYCWGVNDNGQLGDGSTNESTTPVAVDASGVLNGKTLESITSGIYFTCTLDTSGYAYCWGNNINGELGNNSFTQSSSPVAVYTSGALSGKTLTQIDSGFVHSCVLDTDGKSYCWGYNNSGRLGDGTTDTSSVPVAVVTSGELNGKTIATISAGGNNSCAIDTTGKAYCWGLNNHGQIGNNTTSSSYVATAVDTNGVLSGKVLSTITIKDSYVCALGDDGRAYCWGANDNGQLGNNASTDSYIPVIVDTSSIASHPTITFDGSEATNVVLVDSTTLTATVPNHALGAVNVTVTNPDGQNDTLNNGYTYVSSVEKPGAPTGLTANPANNAVDLAWTAPDDDGGANITDYEIEYSDDGGSTWNSYTHTPSASTSITVSGLSPATSYTFQVSAINSEGTGDPSNQATSEILSITISSSPTVEISVTPGGPSTVSSVSSTVTVTTNNPQGYDLTLESSGADRNLVNGSNTITPTPGTLSSPASLGMNTWGYRVDGAGGFTGITVAESNVTSSGFNWAGIPENGSSDLIKSTTSPAENDQTTVWYAMRIDNNKPAGTYTNTVLYTAVAG